MGMKLMSLCHGRTDEKKLNMVLYRCQFQSRLTTKLCKRYISTKQALRFLHRKHYFPFFLYTGIEKFKLQYFHSKESKVPEGFM